MKKLLTNERFDNDNHIETIEELERRLYAEYDQRMNDVKEYLVDKIDRYLNAYAHAELKDTEPKDIYENALKLAEAEDEIRKLEARNVRLCTENNALRFQLSTAKLLLKKEATNE